MSTIHNFSENILEVIIGDLVVFGEVVVEHIGADVEVAIVERVASRPTLSAELLTSQYKGMEVTEGEEDSLELIGFGGTIDCLLTELGITTTNVSLQVLGGLVGDLNGAL